MQIMSKNSLESIVNQSMQGLMRTQMRLFRKLKKITKSNFQRIKFSI
jgi:hypothetical protein